MEDCVRGLRDRGKRCRRQPLQVLCDVNLRVIGVEGTIFGLVIRVGGRGKKSSNGRVPFVL